MTNNEFNVHSMEYSVSQKTTLHTDYMNHDRPSCRTSEKVAISSDLYRKALAAFASSVIVASTTDRHGEAQGFTATAFSAVSLAPPIVQFCLTNSATCYDAFASADSYAISVLGPDQESMAQRFATRGADKFANGAGLVKRGGLWVVKGAQAVLICRSYGKLVCGDHTIFLGEVIDAEAMEAPDLMIYFRKKYLSKRTSDFS